MDVERRASIKSLLDNVADSGEKVPFSNHVENIISRKELRNLTCATEMNNVNNSSSRQVDEDGTFTKKELEDLIDKRAQEKHEGVVETFIGNLTLHGAPQYYETTGIRKFLWAIVLFIMTGLNVHLAFLSYSPENQLKQIIELLTMKVDEIDFPTITVCTHGPVVPKNAFQRFPVNITEEEFKLFYKRVLSNRREGDFVSDNFTRRVLSELKEKNITSYTSILQLFELNDEADINSLFVRTLMKNNSCSFENKPCDFKRDFKIVYRHTSQSLCLQFNYYQRDKPGRTSTGNDLENGLSMFWDVSGEHYFYDSGLHGLMMEIHPYGTPHHLIDHQNTLYLTPGVCAMIDLTEFDTQRLPPPFKPNCGVQQQEIITGYPYSQPACQADCYLENIFDKCGCVVDQFSEFVVNRSICQAVDMPCVFSASQEFHCHSCPLQCNDVHYHVTMSSLGLGSRTMHEFFQHAGYWKNKTAGELVSHTKENIVGFRICFRTLEKQFINYVQRMPWFERFSLLGGTIGILMGPSVTTCFELLFLMVDYSIISIKHYCTRKYLSKIFNND